MMTLSDNTIRAPGFCPTNLPNCLTSWRFESILASGSLSLGKTERISMITASRSISWGLQSVVISNTATYGLRTAACLMSLQVCSKSIEDSTRSRKSSRTSGIPEEFLTPSRWENKKKKKHGEKRGPKNHPNSWLKPMVQGYQYGYHIVPWNGNITWSA